MAKKAPANRTDAGVERDEHGRFVKGSSGNYAGKRKRTETEVKALDAIYAKAWPTLDELLNDPTTPPRVKVDIAKFAIEQRDGKATQRIAGAEGGTPVVKITLATEMDAIING